MNSKIKTLLALMYSLGISDDPYIQPFELESDKFEYLMNETVNDCQLKLYLYLITGRKEDLKAFDEVFNKLSKKEQAFIQKDYEDIINKREQQNNKKTKLKKKGE